MDLLTADLDGPIAYADHGGPAGAPTIVLVHGLGASNLSWLPLAERLTDTHRVLALDLVGSGHSAPEGRGVGVADNRDHLARFLRTVVGGPVHLVGNSMGGMVSAMTAQAHPGLVESLVLLNPALPGGVSARSALKVDPKVAAFFVLYNLPVVGEAFLRLRRHQQSPREQVMDILSGLTTDPSRIEPRIVDLLVSQATSRRGYAWADDAFLGSERSVIRELTVHRSRYLSILGSLPCPTLLLHGEDDRIVPVAAARDVAARIPELRLEVMADVGHAPQLEVPDELAGRLSRFVADVRADAPARQVV